MDVRKRTLSVLQTLLMLGLTGCGQSGPELAEVTGRITVEGKPLPHAKVTFVPQTTTAGPSSGVTNKQGVYKLGYSRDKSGAWVGTHDVTVKGLEVPDAATLDALKQSGIDPAAIPKSPKKYLNPGELTADVARGGNTIDFELRP